MSAAGIKARHLTFEGLLEIHCHVSNLPKDRIRFKNKENLNYCIETTRGFPNDNKSTAYQVAGTFLRANKFHLSVPESEIDDVVLLMRDITAGKISLQNIKDWIRKHITPYPTNLHKPVESEETEIIPVDDVKDISAVATKENAFLLKALSSDSI